MLLSSSAMLEVGNSRLSTSSLSRIGLRVSSNSSRILNARMDARSDMSFIGISFSAITEVYTIIANMIDRLPLLFHHCRKRGEKNGSVGHRRRHRRPFHGVE